LRNLGALPDLADFGKQNLKEFRVFLGQATATQRKQAPLGKIDLELCILGTLRHRRPDCVVDSPATVGATE
jgi:hypothetical protein